MATTRKRPNAVTDRPGGGKCPDVGVPALRAVQSPNLTLADVYRDHVDFVVKIARHLRIPAAHLEDVVHEVFLVVHRRLADFDGRANLRSWLYGITRRVAMHHHRGESRSRARAEHAPAPNPSPNVEDHLARKQAVVWVERCLSALDDDQRLVFVLADIEGIPAPQIASDHGIKLNTVYSRLRLARGKFERALQRLQLGEGFPEGVR